MESTVGSASTSNSQSSVTAIEQNDSSLYSGIPSQPHGPSQSVERPQDSTFPSQSSVAAIEQLENDSSSYSGIPYQPYGPSQSVERPQPHPSGPTQPSIVLAQSPRTSGESWNSDSERSSSLTPQQYTSSPLQQSAPTTPSMYSGSYRLPGASTPQGHSINAGVSQDVQPFMSRTSGSPFGHVPSNSRNPSQAGPYYSHPVAYNSIGTTTSQTYRNANAFVASDHFRPSDGLTFDGIPAAGHAGTAMPTPQASQPIYAGTSQQFVHQPTSQFYFFFADFLKQIILQTYLLLLLRLPSLYFSRVARIFEQADMSLAEIKMMALETALTNEYEMEMAFRGFESRVTPAFKRLISTWEHFIDSVMREWKTFNIVSVLFLSAILTILQIESAAEDPLTRYTALFSLLCSLISLLFGCMYIIRFGSMQKSYKAAQWVTQWALDAQKFRPLVWWNLWILLAMPAIWLSWSIILYIVCIMSFIWRTGVTSTTPPGLSDTGLLIIRIFMTVVLGIGVLYGLLIMTTFQQFVNMDKEWKRRIDTLIEEIAVQNTDYPDLDDRQYPPPHWHPDRSARYQRPTPSRYYQPSFSGGYPRNTPPSSPAYAQPIIVPLPPGSPHSALSNNSSSINRPGPNQPAPQPDSWVLQPSLGGTTSAPNSGAPAPQPDSWVPQLSFSGTASAPNSGATPLGVQS